MLSMTDLSIISSYLGIEIKEETSYILVNQRSYIENILDIFRMSDCNSLKTPMEVGLKLEKVGRGEEKNPSLFRSLIGSLRYLVHTRPDITYSVNYLSRFMNKPNLEHMTAVKRILRYIKETSSFGLRYGRGNKHSKILAYSDCDFPGDNDDQKSTTGQNILLGNSAITWYTVKQNMVALSSCEVEYIAA